MSLANMAVSDSRPFARLISDTYGNQLMLEHQLHDLCCPS